MSGHLDHVRITLMFSGVIFGFDASLAFVYELLLCWGNVIYTDSSHDAGFGRITSVDATRRKLGSLLFPALD